MPKIEMIQGDCLEKMKDIPSGSIDLIVIDPPYGIIKMKDKSNNYSKLHTSEKWDSAIEPQDIYEMANRVLRKNGKMILFSQEPYTSRLINEEIANLPFSYRAIWEKNDFANALGVNKAMVSFYEDILIFNKKHDLEKLHPLREYFLIEKEISGLSDSQIKKILNNRMGGHYFTRGCQFSLPTKANYGKLQTTGHFKRDWNELKEVDDKFKGDLPSVFNLWQGKKYKSNILKYKKDYQGLHPTQKPVLLLEDLIKTYSNEGDTVLDFTMGSGTTGVACKNLNRNFIGIELDPEYFKIAEKRINESL